MNISDVKVNQFFEINGLYIIIDSFLTKYVYKKFNGTFRTLCVDDQQVLSVCLPSN